jgi:hypothetical protein
MGKPRVCPRGYVFAPKTNCGILCYGNGTSREVMGRFA